MKKMKAAGPLPSTGDGRHLKMLPKANAASFHAKVLKRSANMHIQKSSESKCCQILVCCF